MLHHHADWTVFGLTGLGGVCLWLGERCAAVAQLPMVAGTDWMTAAAILGAVVLKLLGGASCLTSVLVGLTKLADWCERRRRPQP